MSLLFRFVFPCIFLLILAIGSSQDKNAIDKKPGLEKIYREADKNFVLGEKGTDESKQDQLNKLALDGFNMIISDIAALRNDSLSFYCYLKAGILEHYFGNFGKANQDYNGAIAFRSTLHSTPDSIFFKPIMYSGIIYYQQSRFDSALIRFKQAEGIADEYNRRLQESERLFNNLGVLYFETGNYGQAKNYFEEAIATLRPDNIYYKEFLVNYKINLAQVLTKQENYDAAYTIYQDIIHYNINKNEIYHNLGSINLTLGAAREAIEFLRKVNYENEPRQIKLYNDLGYAFFNLGINDSAAWYYKNANEENQLRNGSAKNTAHGLTLKYKGDLLTSQGKYPEALHSYQQAIIQFDRDFNDSTISSHPREFSGIFSYINLFDALAAKALAFEKYFEKERQKNDLINSLNAYRSAFALADYVEKTYESDEARLFLNQVKYKVHARPINVAIRLFELTKEKKWLEEGYRFDQLNKASVLSFSLQENALQKQAGVPDELLHQQSRIKSTISQLNLKAAKTSDEALLKEIRDELRDNEIQLARLQEKINSNAEYSSIQSADRIPTIAQLQHKLLDGNSMLLSYHFSDSELVCFYISNQNFGVIRQKVDALFFTLIDSFLSQLRHVNGGEKYSGAAASADLWKVLVKPLQSQLRGISRLVIVPDDELNYLPFEAMQDERQQYMVEIYSIQYQYSTSLLNINDERHFASKEGTLGFAPFAKIGSRSFQSLKYSQQELENLNGKILTDRDANKKNFLKYANHYPVIHLATHAKVNDSFPMQSFIAFFPGEKDSTENSLLYAQEIYDLKLDSTRLIILSACETGTGQLVRGEGLMSLSRAFAYSGCPNIITSLWKAEDRSTAFLTQRLHFYLDKNLVPDQALQKAKIDLLRSTDIDPNLKTPNYWAQLIYIGNFEKTAASRIWWWIAGVIVISSAVAVLLRKKNPKAGNQSPGFGTE